MHLTFGVSHDPAAGQGGPRPLAARDPAHWLRERLDQPPTRRLAGASVAAAGVVLAVLLIREVADEMGMLRRRATHLAVDRWTRLQRRERRGERHTEMAIVARWIAGGGDRPSRPARQRSRHP